MNIFLIQGSAERRRRAFTLIEMIGALSIMTILGTLVMQSALENLKRSARSSEAQNIAGIASALQTSVLRTKTIPGTNNWAAAVSGELLLSSSRILTNSANNPRLLIVDPDCRVGIDSSKTLPYQQTNGGSIQPISLRMVLASSLAAPLPVRAYDTSAFSNLWNTLPGTIPSVLATNWSGTADDLKVQQLDLSCLFNRVVLTDLDSSYVARYSIDTTNTSDPVTPVPNNTPSLEMWLLNGSVMNLYDNNTNLTAREYITGDACYTFEYGQWGRYVRLGTNYSGWFGSMVDLFLATTNSSSRRYTTQQWIVDSMYSVLYNFGQWSQDRFTNTVPRVQAWDATSAATNALINSTKDLYLYKY